MFEVSAEPLHMRTGIGSTPIYEFMMIKGLSTHQSFTSFMGGKFIYMQMLFESALKGFTKPPNCAASKKEVEMKITKDFMSPCGIEFT